ncbi:hypothetical protein J6590_017138 [Homalodisca vitripennis]|nr:hypothetical protein J6590_017138 [Homalodisca vitripennis]
MTTLPRIREECGCLDALSPTQQALVAISVAGLVPTVIGNSVSVRAFVTCPTRGNCIN